MNGFENSEVCTKCKGDCCKHYSGVTFPSDFGQSPEDIYDNLKAAIETHNMVIDWWDGDPRDGHDELNKGYFPRPAHKDSPWPRDPSWGGECVFLESTGCKLLLQDRPAGCRMLEPKSPSEAKCKSPGYGKQEAAIAWLPYRDAIERILNKCE